MVAGSETGLAAGRQLPLRRLLTVGAAIAAVLAILSLLLAVRSHSHQPYGGDEPHYLVIANSLILDGDVDVKNDYLSERYLPYYPFLLDPHVNTSIFTPESRHWYPEHGVGLAAVLVPAVLVDDANGAKVAMVIIAVVVLLLTFLWVRRFADDIWPAVIAVGALGVSPFFLGLEGRIFPDLVTAALLLGCLLILEQPNRRAWHLALLGVLAGASPWLHYKSALVFGTIVAVAFVQLVRSTSGAQRAARLLLLAVPVVVSVVGYELSIRAWYGSWLPTRMVPPGVRIFALSEARGLAAVSFDSGRGLFTSDPALLLILVGLPIWMRRWPAQFRRLALIVGPTILVQATFSDWSGGFAPPARYAVDFVPALVPAIAIFLREAPRVFRAAAGALLGFSWALAAAFVWLRPPWALTGARSPFFAALDHRLGPALDRGMPTFDFSATLVRGGLQLAAWIGVSVALLTLGASLSRSRAR